MIFTGTQKTLFEIQICFGSEGGSQGGGSSRSSTIGGRGGPRSQQQAVRDAQRHHATGSFANPSPMSDRERATYGGAIAGAIGGARGGLGGIGLGAFSGAVGGYLSSR